MADPVQLHGYRFSAYTRIVRLALLSKGVAHQIIEIDPFAGLPDSYAARLPFARVPLLTHGGFELFETSAITRYVDRAFAGPALQPESSHDLARMDQIVAIIDAYAYWPMVRQVASHGFSRPAWGEAASEDEIDAGLKSTKPILAVLEKIAQEGRLLNGQLFTLADCHLAPMVDYFVRAEAGRSMFNDHPALLRWWQKISSLEAMKATDPFLNG